MTPIINNKLFLIVPMILVMSCVVTERDKLEVMTFNIRYENPDDGMFAWESRKEMIFWLIEKYDPDILGVQEALKSQMDELDNALNGYYWSGAGRSDGMTKGEYVPVFYRKDKFTLLKEGHFWLSEHPGQAGSLGWDAACTRIVSWIELQDIKTENVYYVFNTHFDHLGEEARKKSARLLSDSIESIAGGMPVIITGDLNCEPDSDPVSILSELLEDARIHAIENDPGSGTTYVGFPADLSTDKIIDHIFISPHFDVEEFEIITDNSRGFFPSDHLPVRVRLLYDKK